MCPGRWTGGWQVLSASWERAATRGAAQSQVDCRSARWRAPIAAHCPACAAFIDMMASECREAFAAGHRALHPLHSPQAQRRAPPRRFLARPPLLFPSPSPVRFQQAHERCIRLGRLILGRSAPPARPSAFYEQWPGPGRPPAPFSKPQRGSGAHTPWRRRQQQRSGAQCRGGDVRAGRRWRQRRVCLIGSLGCQSGCHGAHQIVNASMDYGKQLLTRLHHAFVPQAQAAPAQRPQAQ